MYAFITQPGPAAYGQSQQHQFTPKTPSPLRTSRNANLMPPPLPCTFPPTPDTKSSPLAPSASVHPPFSVNTRQPRRASTPSVFFASASTSACHAHASSDYASRSQASTPTAAVSARNAAAKDRRKSLFRDKIRKQRDDARFEGRGDQVLRMDFVQERREWEERLARRAPADLDGDESMEGTDEVRVGENEVVPLTEEGEIEALAQYLLEREGEDLSLREGRDGEGGRDEQEQSQQLDHRQDFRADGFGNYGSDDEDYDQLFMEVISGSQEGQGGSGQWSEQPPRWDEGAGPDGFQGQSSSSMDLS